MRADTSSWQFDYMGGGRGMALTRVERSAVGPVSAPHTTSRDLYSLHFYSKLFSLLFQLDQNNNLTLSLCNSLTRDCDSLSFHRPSLSVRVSLSSVITLVQSDPLSNSFTGTR